MNTKQIMELDFRKEESKEIIQKVLKQIKPLSRYSDECEIPLNAIEKVLFAIYHKYGYGIQYAMPSFNSNDKNIVWHVRIMRMQKDSQKILNIDTVYGISIYEAMAKATIRIYAEIRKRTKK